MKTNKIIGKILRPYRKMIREIGEDITIIQGKTFCCWCSEKEIEIPVFEDTLGAENFKEKMGKRLKQYNINENFSSELLSFLHEVGHIKTYKKINEITYRIGTNLITNLQAKFTNEKYVKFFYGCYFNLKLERYADKWAMEFIKNNIEICKKWDKELYKNYNKYLPQFINHCKYKYKVDIMAS